jgi:hypothetical protein
VRADRRGGRRDGEGSSFFQFALGFYNSHRCRAGSVDLWQSS